MESTLKLGKIYQRGEPVDQAYDVVVIGSGLSGMTAAKVLAEGQKKVLLLEAHNKLGGFATWFFRDQRQFVFDISLHGFPVGMKKTCRKYWGEKIASKIVQIKKIRLTNPQFDLETDYTKEDFKRLLVEYFKADPKTVEEFFLALKQMNFYDQSKQTIGELFEQFFPGRKDIWRLLLEPITYANGSTLDDPAIAYGIVFSNFMDKGVYTFEGGTDYIIGLMKEELLKAGVDIKFQTLVQKIITEPMDQLGGKPAVVGVSYRNEKQRTAGHDEFITIKTNAVLSNANLLKTIFSLLGEQYLKPDYLKQAKKVRVNTSSCQVYLGINRKRMIPHMGELIFTSTHPEYDDSAILNSFPVTSRTFSIYYPSARPQLGEHPTTIVASTNACYEDWKALSPEQYEQRKEELMKTTIEALEQLIPGITPDIIFKEAATPLTIEKFTHHHQGASFGTKFEGLEVSAGLSDQIAGLYHSGSVGIIMSGWLGAANYGVIQANKLESEYRGKR